MKKIIRLFSVVLFAVMLSLSGSADAEIKLGILPRLGPVELYTMFNPLAAYLTRETGEKVSIVIPKDFSGFKDAVQHNKIDLAFSNPLVYIQLQKDLSVKPLAVAVESRAGSRFRGIIICRKDSSIRKIQDLKGKKLVFVDKDSAAGYMFQMLLLSKSGLSQADFTLLPFAKKHDNVLQSVFYGSADAGGIREDDFEKMKERVDVSQIRILAYTDYFPNWPMYASSTMNPETIEKITRALRRLKPNSETARKILKPALLTGFEPIADEDYEQLRSAARLVGAL